MAGKDYLPESLRDQSRLLRVADKSYDHEYVQGLKDGQSGGGYEQMQAAAKVGARVSLAIARLEAGRFKLYAQGGTKATGTVQFFRPTTGGPAINIMPGTVVETGIQVLAGQASDNPIVMPNGAEFIPTGVRFVTTELVHFDADAIGPVECAIEAEACGYEFNTTGQVTRASGEVLEGDICVIRKRVTDVPTFDPLMMVRQIADTTGGRAAWLDGIGDQFNIPRIGNESDDQYRLRIEQIGDAVSPDAIKRAVDKILGQYGYECTIYEIGEPPFAGFFNDAGSSADSPQYPDWNFANDMDFDAQPLDRFKLVMSLLESRAFFLVGVPRLTFPDFGFFNDAGSSADSPQYPDWNFANDMTDPGKGANDGAPLRAGDVYGAIWQQVYDKHAGGVGFDLVLDE